MRDFLKFYKSKIIEFSKLNLFHFVFFITSEVLITIFFSMCFLLTINYFIGGRIAFLNSYIASYPIYIFILICFTIFFLLVLKFANKFAVTKLLNLSKINSNNFQFITLNRAFILSVTGNLVSIIILLIILYFNTFDFLFFFILNFFFILYTLSNNGKWVTRINNDDLVERASAHFLMSKNSEILTIIFYFFSFTYCVINHFLYNENVLKYIFLILCSRYFIKSISDNIKLLFIWKRTI